MSSARTVTLVDVVVSQASGFQNALLVVGTSAFTAALAQVAIPVPWSPVPLTGQTFAVLLSGAVLGTRRSFLAQWVYLLEGAIGLPVFAGGTTGMAKFFGPTGGYLLAFPFAAAVTGFLAERSWDRRFTRMLVAMLLGSGIVLGIGLLGLSRFVPSSSLLAVGLYPYIPGDVLKSVLAALAFPTAWRWVNLRAKIGPSARG